MSCKRTIWEEKTMRKIVPSACYCAAFFAALMSFITLAASVERTRADKPSTPVTVTNPATDPALVSDIDDPGRSAYQSASTNDSCAGQNNCLISFPAVPPGHRLVIQHISGQLAFTGDPGYIRASLSLSREIPSSLFFVPFHGNVSLFDRSVLFYVDPESPEL
jgi:hypothetical protein